MRRPLGSGAASQPLGPSGRVPAVAMAAAAVGCHSPMARVAANAIRTLAVRNYGTTGAAVTRNNGTAGAVAVPTTAAAAKIACGGAAGQDIKNRSNW